MLEIFATSPVPWVLSWVGIGLLVTGSHYEFDRVRDDLHEDVAVYFAFGAFWPVFAVAGLLFYPCLAAWWLVRQPGRLIARLVDGDSKPVLARAQVVREV